MVAKEIKYHEWEGTKHTKNVDTFDLWICIEKKFHLFQFEIEKPNESVLHGQSTA